VAVLLRAKRPRDIVINAGVAFDDRRKATFFKMTSPVFNTFCRDQAEKAIRASRQWAPHEQQEIVEQIEVPLLPINMIAADHAPSKKFDMISIDTEGVDLAILQSIDLGILRNDPEVPAVICVEASSSLEETSCAISSAGFEFVARTPDNWIFRRHRERLRPLEE
jgi:hypothetical protein